jgi:hypothetical protein
MFSQGYIGVAAKGAVHRFKEHQSKARGGSKLPIHNAIRKYGELLIIEEVILADVKYCYELENKLRPTPRIGYNCDAGGNCNRLGSKLSEDTRQKLSFIAKAQGRKPNQAALDNSAKTNSKKVAWLCQFSNKSVWKMADEVYKYFVENPTHGYSKAATALGVTKDQLSTMFKKIKAGWNPNEDTEWLIFSGKLTPDASGDKSIQSGISPI